jgi:hypothetical protein
MSFFPLLVGFANRIENLQWDLLWGGIDEELQFHLISPRCVLQFHKVGLGSKIYFCSTKLFWASGFDPLLMKEASWRVVVDSKYGN